MRTTVELPPELMRAAKAHAADQGISLKEFFTRVVSAELDRRPLYVRERSSALRPFELPKVGRVSLPLFGSRRKTGVRLTNADIEEIFAKEDAEKYGGRRK